MLLDILVMMQHLGLQLLRSYKMYKLFKDPMGINDVGVILNNNTAIPFAPDNTDYQDYLEWLEEGGVPTPADE